MTGKERRELEAHLEACAACQAELELLGRLDKTFAALAEPAPALLKPGGRLVITLDNRRNVFDPVLRLAHWLGMVPYFLGRSYTVDELRRELGAAGFQVQETTAILHNPRLLAMGTRRLARWLRWRALIEAVQRLMLAAQGLEKTRLCHYTGSFVAALAIRPQGEGQQRTGPGEQS